MVIEWIERILGSVCRIWVILRRRREKGAVWLVGVDCKVGKGAG